MEDFIQVKLEIFIPVENLSALQQVLAQVGAGQIGNYDHCCAVSQVQGYWQPLKGSTPFLGTVGQIECKPECKVEVNCKRELVQKTIMAIRAVHPYEEPLINITPLANHLFSS